MDDAIHPDDRQGAVDYWRSCVISGIPGDMEARMRRHDGVYRWFLFRANPVRNAEGNISRWFGTSVDIEDRKRGEEALHSNERNLSLIINTIPAHIYVLNTEGSVQYVNQAVMDYTGLSLEDVQQEDYRDRVIHPEDFKRVRAPRAAGLGGAHHSALSSASWATMGNIAGSWCATSPCSMSRDESFGGMWPHSTSRTANARSISCNCSAA